MPTSGSGTMTPAVAPAVPSDIWSVLGDVQLGLTLDRYQEIMRIPEAAFNGLLKSDDENCDDCNAIWKQRDRDAIALAIARAEEMRERELGYHVAPKYDTNEEHEYKLPVILDHKHLVGVGTAASSDISLSKAISLGLETAPNDPVIVIVPTTVTDPDEICIYHPGTDVRINPKKVEISGGFATIQIPRSRLISPSIDTECDPPPDYYENDNFITSIDIKRCYRDPSTGAYFVWFGSCTAPCPSTITETTQTAYAKVRNVILAVLDLFPAYYSGGTWSFKNFSMCCDPTNIRVNYRSGIQSSIYTEMITAGLAHTLLPELIPDNIKLCQCWQPDMAPHPSGLVTPYGHLTGAVNAWVADSRAHTGMGGKF